MATLLMKRNLAKPLGIGLLSHALVMGSSARKTSCEGVIKASASTVAHHDNPLLKKDGTPLFREIKPEHVVPALEHDLSKLKHDFKGLSSTQLDAFTSIFLSDTLIFYSAGSGIERP